MILCWKKLFYRSAQLDILKGEHERILVTCWNVRLPRKKSYKVAGAGGMKEGLNVPNIILKCLKLHTATNTQNLFYLDLAVKHRKLGKTLPNEFKTTVVLVFLLKQ